MTLKQARLIAEVVRAISDNYGPWISGRRLRAKLSMNELPLTRPEPLMPDYLWPIGSYPNDAYRPTLRGLLSSPQKVEIMEAMNGIVNFLRTRFEENPDFRDYTWEDLKRVLDCDDAKFRLIETIITASGLSSGASAHFPGNNPDRISTVSNASWKTPVEIELLVRLDADGLVDYSDTVLNKKRSRHSVDDCTALLVMALAEFSVGQNDSKRGRHNLPGPTVRSEIFRHRDLDLSPDQINDAVCLLEEHGLVSVRHGAGTNPYKFMGVELTYAGRAYYEDDPLEVDIEQDFQADTLETPMVTDSTVLVFISHSAVDEALAARLVDTLQRCMELADSTIRCTSVPGHKLPIGADGASTIKSELAEASAVIGLITPNSLASSWVLFELGAAWGADRKIFPLLYAFTPPSQRDASGRVEVLTEWMEAAQA